MERKPSGWLVLILLLGIIVAFAASLGWLLAIGVVVYGVRQDRKARYMRVRTGKKRILKL